MNRRIRKKKHLGEFDYKGFDVRCTYDVVLDVAGATAFKDSVVMLAEENDLCIGGGFGPQDAEFVVTRVRGRRPGDKRRIGYAHCTQEDRDLIGDHLRAQPFMGDFVIGPLEGMWHG